jgi:hypothetical protein
LSNIDKGDLLAQVERVIAVLSAAENFDEAEYYRFLRSSVQDLDDALELTTGIIGFLSGMLDSVGVDLKDGYAQYGMAAQMQIIENNENNK